MGDGEIVPPRQEFAEDRLFGRPLMDVFWLDETELARIPPDGSRVIDQHLNKQVALIPWQLDD